MLTRVNGRVIGVRHNGRNAVHCGKSGMHYARSRLALLLSSADLNLSNLYYSAIPVRGAVTPSMTRATVKTIQNNDGYMVTLLAGELGFPGARRVYNLWTTSSATLANLANKSLTLPAGAYQFSMGAGTGTATFSGTGGATGTLAASASGRVSVAKTITAGTFVVTASVADLVDLQVVSMVAETDQTTAREYVSVGVLSAPAYHGSMVDGVKCFPTDLSGNRLTGMTTPLIELASTNRCKYSEDFTNAVWVSGGGGIAVTPNTAVAPDGTTTADTLTASGANGTLIQDLGVVASAAKSGGLYLKRKTGTGNVDLTLNGGTNWTTQTINSTTWTRCDLSLTVADEDFGIRLVTSGDEVYAAKAMVATEAELTSYIANLAGSTTTRNADQFYYTGALLGTLKSLASVDFKREAGFANQGIIASLDDGSATNAMLMYMDNATALYFQGQASGPQWSQAASNAYTPGTLSSVAFSAATNDIKMAKDAIAQAPDLTATVPVPTRLNIGCYASGILQLNGYPGIPYGWVRQLSQSELGAVTA